MLSKSKNKYFFKNAEGNNQEQATSIFSITLVQPKNKYLKALVNLNKWRPNIELLEVNFYTKASVRLVLFDEKWTSTPKNCNELKKIKDMYL